LRHVRDPEVTLDVYGAGPEDARLRRITNRLGMANRVRFMGQVPRSDLLSALERATIFVHPALHEEAGFVVAEALALGVPVVALDHGGPAVVVEFYHGVPSRMVDPSTPRKTARRIAEAIDDLIVRPRVPPPTANEDPFGQALLSAYQQAVRMPG